MGHRYPVTLESADFPSSQVVLDKFKVNTITVINNIITITNSIECLTTCQGVKLLICMISFNPITNLRLRGTKSYRIHVTQLGGGGLCIQTQTGFH